MDIHDVLLTPELSGGGNGSNTTTVQNGTLLPSALESSSVCVHSNRICVSPSAADGPTIIVRTEEVLIVMLVLILWVGAIALFFNRWGKIRMLEPYQPKFQHQQHRSSCPLVEIESLSPIAGGSAIVGVSGVGVPTSHGRASFSRMSMGCSLQIPPASHFGSMSGAGYASSMYAVRGERCFNIPVPYVFVLIGHEHRATRFFF